MGPVQPPGMADDALRPAPAALFLLICDRNHQPPALICDVHGRRAVICPINKTSPSKQELMRDPDAAVANM